MDQLPETIACPYCGNINPFLQENCMKCKKPLGPIRAAMQSGTGSEQPGKTQTLPNPIEPAPPMPDLPKVTIEKIKYLGRKSFLIRGMGDKNIEIASRFFKRLNEKDLKNILLSVGELNVDVGSNQKESREYYFVRKDLELNIKGTKAHKVGQEAVKNPNFFYNLFFITTIVEYLNRLIERFKERYTYLLMAIRIAPVGPDLYVEWRHYYYRKTSYEQWGWWLGLIGWIIAPFVTDGGGIAFMMLLGFVGLAGGIIGVSKYSENKVLKGFQLQENEMFQLSVRATLEEAIDLAGIPKSLIQNNSMDENKERII